jgi:hypothetical protein
MRANLIHCIQIVCLAVAISYNADAQTRGSIRPLPPEPVAAGDLVNRESTKVIELGARGLANGQKRSMDITREVVYSMSLPRASSLVILASANRGTGQLDLLVNGRYLLRQAVALPMKRKAIQVDLNNISFSDLRSVVIETSGQVLVHSVTVNSSRGDLPNLEDTQGSIDTSGRFPVTNEVCDVDGAGIANGRYTKYRILLKGQAIDGSDSIDDIVNRLSQLEASAVCRPAQTECSLGGAGIAGGQYSKIVIKKNKVNFAGADDINKLLEINQKLSEGRICQMAVHNCQLATAGIAAGQYFQHRLLVNGEAILGANDLGSMLNQLNQLRRLNICQ